MIDIESRLRAWAETGSCFGLDSIGQDCLKGANEIATLKQHNAELLKDAQRLRHVFGGMRNRRVDSITLEEIDAAIDSAEGK